MKRLVAFPALLLLVSVAACRGGESKDQPIHIVPDMDWQPKYQPYEASVTFADGRAMRPAVEGTIAQGQLHEDRAFWEGKVVVDGTTPDAPKVDAYVAKAPVTVDEKLLDRGQERYGIYCAPCHDQSGHGRGMVVQRGYPPPLDLTGERVRGLPDGEIFNVMTNGVRNMPSYRKQVPAADRWAIVAWLRVLQRSQAGAVSDVPSDQVGQIAPEQK